MVARHVRYWRGQVHRWSTVYPFTGSVSAGSYGAAIAALKTMEQGICYGGSVVAGGLYEIALYDHASGGVPVAVQTYFDWTAPGGWVNYTSAGWASGTSPAVLDVAEAALQLEWQAGLSRSGKPVLFRKWYHAVPTVLPTPGAPDVPTTNISSLKTLAQTQMAAISALGITLGNSSRLAATTPTVRPYYGNHQMPRGRRRLAASASKASTDYSAILKIINGEVSGE
uniref:Uncharacterized protein n=1 Tax=uncultured prokaryote TaxID=198431 RepID=A0A0H5Q2L7_9ZZZZ|nr:hypothetical protein [uncultured prokaryote]